ncbi:response regulator transcription factor [Streptomyces antimycoticus]|uniref:Response regulator transcription factor n=2 Tax=Streptomyces TaxID=1883 RepID=A0ABD5JEW7_9ACTN|nr:MULTISPECIES: response regulator transcription factor [Streptomyces]MEE4586307.1 response regulator transcription factor [Streptomyces sp. DSM 41602]QTI90173.1 response regulator transcription factor [Streptomyces sp. AgN23]RSS39383.1 DNA-binding response regulator [Streptomyces sp. WAC05858]WJD94962.1 response regulator transcription factor [Streptomyces antimycoticus]WTA86258.1 response regulator transcription factor [Streptomyces antimycoticus]
MIYPADIDRSTADQTRLLLIEDDRETADMLAELFSSEGYDVEVAFDGHRGLHLGLSRRHQVMVVDRMIPGIEGLDLVKRLRRVGVTTRVLVLTALGELGERVTGLDSGADDYLVKPFEVDELLARVRALHRRDLSGAEILPLGEGELDLRRREVRLADGTGIELSLREFGLLHALAEGPKIVHDRSHLRERVFPDTSAESIVDTYVYYLRRKLGRDVVRTVRGRGYQMGTL